MDLSTQIIWLFLLAVPIACIAWTVTHEEVFREPREFCERLSNDCNSVWKRKFFYLFTCEYCFSHYVTVAALFFTDYHLLLDNWKGYVLAGFSLVWIANIYMSLFGFLRINIKKDRVETKVEEIKIEEQESVNSQES
ncbi:hypothetical protein GS399_09590 [Pedobacter sp. HMF7647]|uniref:DUF1360 domain-containing protein n=1 Tax=Hufsiella arboris TaxID=2695275 RepID=A0A7K1Y9X7_9SPHI|nr:hypothetical protein [Hufsiella arboris]MXV51220.1 hypothetical protein [Hufsiella arboris]